MIVMNYVPTYLFSLYLCLYLLIECLFSMSTGTMSSFPSGFNETNVMFLEFVKDLDNHVGGSSSVGDDSGESNNGVRSNSHII